MKKKTFALCVALLIFIMPMCAFAAEEYLLLQDTAQLLSATENAVILAKLNNVSKKHGMDIAIFTTDSVTESFTVEEDATETYEALGYGNDGVMLYISMAEGDWYLLTRGYGITAITDAGIEYISDKFVDNLSEGDFVNAFSNFITLTDEFILQAKTGEPYDVGNMPKKPYNVVLSLIVSLAIGFIASLIITGKWRSSLTSVAFQRKAANYVKGGSLNIAQSRDFFLYRRVDRREKQKESDGGGSSTHTSSSGNTYGGGGGKF